MVSKRERDDPREDIPAAAPRRTLTWLPTKGEHFYDDVTGFPLDPKLVRRARVEEREFMHRLDVWGIVDRGECVTRTGRQPIPVRWVDFNRGT